MVQKSMRMHFLADDFLSRLKLTPEDRFKVQTAGLIYEYDTTRPQDQFK